MPRAITFFSAVLSAALILSGCAIHAGNAPEIVDARTSVRQTVQTALGPVVGAASSAGQAFLGIPYAAPPVGPLRWKPPQPVRPWAEPRDAVATGPICAQDIGIAAAKGKGGGLAIGDEDCLYLNIYTPPVGAQRPVGGWPVMAYIPGGAFNNGAGDYYNPSPLAASQGIIVVTMNYRLGAFGFLALHALRDESPDGGSGNFGLFDQQAALRWVQGNIAAFGGDAANVTLTGESAGAWSVCYQMVSPGAKGLFVRAIMQSGSCTDRRSLARADEADRDGDAFARKLGCGDSDDVLACLRKLPAGKIARAPSPRRGVIGPGSWGPVWKDPVVPLNPAEAFATGRYNAVPVIIGTNRDEGRLFALTVLSVGNQKKYEAQLREDWGTRAPDVLAHYPAESYGGSPDLAYAAVLTDGRFACPAQELRGLLAKRSTVRGYEFADEDAPIVLPEFLLGAPMGAYHASELAYVFGSRWVLADVASFTPAQAQLSDRMMRAWGRFVRGEPFAEDWPAGDGVLVFQPQGDATSTDFAQRHQCDFWQGVSVGN